MKKILIITGGSKGIGEAVVHTYRKKGFHVFSLARSVNEDLGSGKVTQVRIDLQNLDEVSDVLDYVFSEIDGSPIPIEKISLINNAGTLGNVQPLEKCDASEIQHVINVNVSAVAVLSAKFIQKTRWLNCEKAIINISSGAAAKPYFGWSLYCSSKAALEMLTKCIAKEQEELTNGVKCLAIIPGVVDTQMQDLIRKKGEHDFKAVQRFIDLKKNGQLSDSDDVAEKIFQVDQDVSVESGAIVSVREN